MATAIPDNTAPFEVKDVVRATRGLRTGGLPHAHTVGVVTDSRRVRPGSLFVALRGERFDAHDFLEDVAAAGAGAAVIQRGARAPDGLVVIEVEDTLVALGRLAALHRRRWAGRLVAVTGSAGKTGTKELTAAALEAALAATGADETTVARTAGNLNNRIGVPMTLFGLGPHTELAVVEIGTSEPGEIATLAEIAMPDVGVITLIAAAHTEGLGDIDAVAVEKSALFRALGTDGVAVGNVDDARVRKALEEASTPRRIGYGRAADASVRMLGWTLEGLRTRARYALTPQPGVAAPPGVDVRLQLLGEGAASNAAAALAVVEALGLPVLDAARGLTEVAPTPGRMCATPGTRGVLVLDDTYNANPRSMQVAFETAAAVAAERGAPWVALLGDMRELGAESGAAHTEALRAAAAAGASRLVVCGPELGAAAARLGSDGPQAVVCRDSVRCAEDVERLVEPGAVALVKGSRTTHMERVVEALVGRARGDAPQGEGAS
ncbi:MAG: UDP-N-acetylmuramoyl-tripeptide--D-alanyl-D-alanine ligase [Myxococcales bacterium]|nr:UDP-N-acetylmuramoyl-tripeptide--D-alanyl-D-alanine ligase [Myxococcales bacterium]